MSSRGPDRRHARDQDEPLNRAYRILKACRSDSRSYRRDDLDQCPATIKTTLARLELLMTIPRIEKRRVLLLGDDDLLSVAIVAAGLSAGVTVVDLDDSLLARIATWVKPSAVELLNHDLRLGLPATISHRYDIVFTDPPYTPAGQMLFLRAAVTALRNVRSASLFLCASSLYLAPPQIQMIIEAAEQAGLKLIRVAQDFNEYKSPPDIVADIRALGQQRKASSFHSSLFHFKPRLGLLNTESFPCEPTEIYNYGKEDVPS